MQCLKITGKEEEYILEIIRELNAIYHQLVREKNKFEDIEETMEDDKSYYINTKTNGFAVEGEDLYFENEWIVISNEKRCEWIPFHQVVSIEDLGKRKDMD